MSLKTKYRHIHFKKLTGVMGQKPRWGCLNNKTKDILGLVEYYGLWRRYAIEYREGCKFDKLCTDDISDFLTQLNNQKKATGGKE